MNFEEGQKKALGGASPELSGGALPSTRWNQEGQLKVRGLGARACASSGERQGDVRLQGG